MAGFQLARKIALQFFVIAGSVLFIFSVDQVAAEQVTVATASNFILPMKAIAESFERDSDHKLTLVFGSSGKIYSQIKNGAPFDVFLSADQDKAIALENESLTETNSRFTYAEGVLALWGPRVDASNSPLKITSVFDVLKAGNFNRLAMANPKLAPYGVAASQALSALGLFDAVSSKIIRGENISQAYQFVSTGNAELGFVALSQLKSNPELDSKTYWLVPKNLHAPILQDAVVLKRAEGNAAVASFIRHLKTEDTRRLIEGFGYLLPAREVSR